MMRKRAEIKKIKGTTSSQITYCKKKNYLLKKCHEISIFCDIDVALVIFAPTGRVSSFCNHEKIEDLIKRYLDRPPKKRYFRFLQKFLPYKLKQLNHIEGDENKLHFLKNQLLELEIQRTTFEREILNNVNNSNVQGIAMTKRSLNFTDQDQFRANGRRTKSQDIHGQANRTSAGALNNYGGHLPCSDCPGTQFLPTNYSSVQSQPVIAYQMTFDTPMQQLGGLIGSSSTGNMVHGGAPIWIQNYQTPQTCTCSYYWNNLSSQNMVAPTSQFQANPNEVYQYSNVNDLILPSSSNLGINTINNYESHRPQFTNSIATAASSAASVAATFNDNGTGPSQVIPPQEDDPLGLLDDFQWAEGLNFDELPSLLE